MAQFVVAAKDEGKMAEAVALHYPDDFIHVWNGLWLVSAESATAEQVCKKLGADNGQLGSVLVTAISGYYGYAGANVWEWLVAKGRP